MNEQYALSKMVAPGDRRPTVAYGGVLQIWVTTACDKACFGCTQGSNMAGKPGMITPEQFEEACLSLDGYFGIVGMFGGNPAIHPKFDVLCSIMRKHIPWERRGLWCNNLLGKGIHARRTFNPSVSNLNVHLDRKAFEEFRETWPEAMPFGLKSDSRHAPPWVAMQDMTDLTEEDRWNKIAACDVNQLWSAMICVFRGELRGFFCEIAGSQAMHHQDEPEYPDLGLPLTSGWWRQPISAFAHQVRHHCHACGVPLRGYGELAQAANGVEQVSETHKNIFRPKVPGREVQLVQITSQLGTPLDRSTNYIQNSQI